MPSRKKSQRSWFSRKARRHQYQTRRMLLDQLERRDMLTVSTPAKFDFGSTSFIETGYTSVTASTTWSSGSYGWASSTSLTNNTVSGNASDGSLRRDFVKGTVAKDFKVDLDNGQYDVTVMMGSNATAQTDGQIKLEGTVADSNIDLSAGIFYTQTFRVTVSDGQLNINFDDTGSSSDAWFANGVEIVPAATIPTALSSLYLDFGPSTASPATGYTRATRFAMYSAMQQYGWLETSPAVETDSSSGDNLQHDYVQGNQAHTFVADMANGTYSVTLTMGSETLAFDNAQLRIDRQITSRLGWIELRRL